MATRFRSRSVTRPRGRTADEVWVNDWRGHSGSTQARRRFRHHNSTTCPHAGRSFNGSSERSLIVQDTTPQAGHGPSRDVCSMTTEALETIVAALQAAAGKADDVRLDAVNAVYADHVVQVMATSLRKLNRLLGQLVEGELRP
jgi:hypothetical protein